MMLLTTTTTTSTTHLQMTQDRLPMSSSNSVGGPVVTSSWLASSLTSVSLPLSITVGTAIDVSFFSFGFCFSRFSGSYIDTIHQAVKIKYNLLTINNN